MQDKPTKHSLSVKVAEQINDLIIRDKLKPGTKLPNEAQPPHGTRGNENAEGTEHYRNPAGRRYLCL